MSQRHDTGEIEQLPEIHGQPIVVSVEQRGNHSWKVKLAKWGAGIAAIAGATLFITDHLPDWPDLPDLPTLPNFGGAAKDAGKAVGEIATQGKEGADKAAAKISNRKVRPTEVDPESVVAEKVKSRASFGLTTRKYKVGHAEKAYDSTTPILGRFNDEKIVLENGVFQGEAFVPGGITSEFSGKTLVVHMPKAEVIDGVTVIQQPEDSNPADLLSQLGKIPGDNTKIKPAMTELLNYVGQMEREDKGLQEAAACSGRQSVVDLLVPTFKNLDLDVFIDSLDNPVGSVDDDPINDLIIQVGAQRPGKRVLYYTAAQCKAILAETGYYDKASESSDHRRSPGQPEDSLPTLVTKQLVLEG